MLPQAAHVAEIFKKIFFLTTITIKMVRYRMF